MTSKVQDGKYITRQTYNKRRTAILFRNELEDLAEEDGRVLLNGSVRRDGHGDRYHVEVITVDADWIRTRKRARDERRAEEQQAKRDKEGRRAVFGCRHSWHTSLSENRADRCPGCKRGPLEGGAGVALAPPVGDS